MSENHFLYTYRAYGLNIVSELPITGFEPTAVEKADVTITEGPVPATLEKTINQGVLYQSNDREFLLHIENLAGFYIHDGNEIVVQRDGQTPTGELSAFLIGTVFGALLHQRRLLPLHASTVIFNNKCLLFAGVSGVGKTTLATAFIQKGGTLLADDISVIDFSGEHPAVRPAFPAVKIWGDSLKHLDIPANGLTPVRDELQKYYLPVEAFGQWNTNLHALFMLCRHNKPDVEIKALQGINKFRLLKKNTYLFRGIPKTGLEQNHFQLVNQLANNVQVFQLIRPSEKFDTEKLVELVLANC